MKKTILLSTFLMTCAALLPAQAAMLHCDNADFEMIAGMSMSDSEPAPLTAIAKLDKDGKRTETIFSEGAPYKHDNGVKYMIDTDGRKFFAFVDHKLVWLFDTNSDQATVYDNCN